ncbi:MAG: 3-isopropylmalate dehydratase large subunit [Phycisphaerae bacterium]|nr:3-isopropylmalate dehydratase large subunit [Phycisphaerae bacterium]
MCARPDPFHAKSSLKSAAGNVNIYRLAALELAGVGSLSSLPYSIRILLEAVLRNVDGFSVLEDHVKAVASWNPAKPGDQEIPFKCARVVLQDFTGVPCVVDLAAMRSAMVKLGGDPKKINPIIPVDLVIDHSVQVDHYATSNALDLNAKLEFHRNRERYEFLRWGQKAFDNFRVVPPATGIVHQVNLEYLAKCVLRADVGGETVAMPDTLVGTDSHTTMINGLGVLGWGVGGIEAEAAMLGQPMYMLMPEVIGFRLTGKLREGATATDAVLMVTEMLRKFGVVEKFVEFYGEGLSSMSVADRATIANMAPEYGATCGFFPVDDQTLRYLRLSGRTAEEIDLVERYCKEQGLFRTDASPTPKFSATLDLDLSTVEPSLAGPKRPQDRVPLSRMKAVFHESLKAPIKNRGFELKDADLSRKASVRDNGHTFELQHGSVVIAAITSCTNTSNPSVMLAAGLIAKKAAEKGLKVKPWVKTSLAPGSRVVTDYLDKAGYTQYLDQLGFNTVGYGCTTCIGNSGPLPDHIRDAVVSSDLVASSVLSGNRNFEGRVNPHVKANYLASPPLVVAYALAGTTDIDLTTEPLGTDKAGKPVFLKDIWPSQQEINDAVERFVTPEQFRKQYADVFTGSAEWRNIKIAGGDVYAWDEKSTYIQHPPYFENLSREPSPIAGIRGARCLVMVGDSVTTDHISPAGDIAEKSPAGDYLKSLGVTKADFNSYGSRRGNDRVMTRGTFANVRLRNLLAPGTEGGVTTYLGSIGVPPVGSSPSPGSIGVPPVGSSPSPGSIGVPPVGSSTSPGSIGVPPVGSSPSPGSIGVPPVSSPSPGSIGVPPVGSSPSPGSIGVPPVGSSPSPGSIGVPPVGSPSPGSIGVPPVGSSPSPGSIGVPPVGSSPSPGSIGVPPVSASCSAHSGNAGGTPTLPTMSIHDAAMAYKAAGTPTIVLAGKDYGMGSSRDWAAKGVMLLGVKAAIATSFERIHRSNLIGMGVLPCVFNDGQTRETLGLTGHEVFDFADLNDSLKPQQDLKVVATHPDSGKKTEFTVRCRVDTPVEIEYYRNGGVLQTVLRKMVKPAPY